MPGGPFLTARATGERHRILDPLGLDAAGASILRRHLLPGLTAGLQHARYFSLMAWIVRSFEMSDTPVQWHTYRRFVEQALRIAIKHADPKVRGLVGTDSTPSLRDDLDAVWPVDVAAPSCFQPAYYGASFTGLGLARKGAGGMPALTPLGRALAQAVETEIASARRAVRAAVRRVQEGRPELDGEDLALIAECFRLRCIAPDEPEHAPLVTAIGGLRAGAARRLAGVVAQDRGPDQVRARVLGLVLALLGEHSVRVTGSDDLLRIVAGPVVPASIRARFPAELEAWRCFGERQVERIALGAIWSAVFRWVRSEAPFGVPVDTLVARAVGLLPSAAEDDHGGDGEEEDLDAAPYADRPWGEFEDVVGRGAGSTRKARFAAGQMLAADLEDCERSEWPMATRIQYGLRLLALAMYSWRVDGREADPIASVLHRHGGEERLPLAWLAREVAARREEPVAAVVRWLIERCVLEQVQRVGYAKGPGTTKLLLVREEDAVVLARDDAEVRPFAQDTNRLGAVLALLEGLSLTERDNARIVRTAAGDEVLEALEGRERRT